MGIVLVLLKNGRDMSRGKQTVLVCGLLMLSSSMMIAVQSVMAAEDAYTFDLSFAALVLRPLLSNLHYAAEATPFPVPSPSWNIYDIPTGYHFGFDIACVGNFHDQHTQLQLHWEHLNGVDTAAINVGTDHMVGPFFEIGPDAAPYTKAAGVTLLHFDQVDVAYGRPVSYGDGTVVAAWGGLSCIRITQDLTALYSDQTGSIARRIDTPTTFTGAGPALGVKTEYSIIDHLSLVTAASAALCVGHAHTSTQYASTSPALQPLSINAPNRQSIGVCARTELVPAMAATIGLRYQHDCADRYRIEVAAGYRAQVYWNALQSIVMGSEVVTPPVIPDTVGVFARTFQRTSSNLALAGAYISLGIAF